MRQELVELQLARQSGAPQPSMQRPPGGQATPSAHDAEQYPPGKSVLMTHASPPAHGVPPLHAAPRAGPPASPSRERLSLHAAVSTITASASKGATRIGRLFGVYPCRGLRSDGVPRYTAAPVSTRFGRYELLRKLAAGGMGEVFLARQWGDGNFFHDVVIKRLHRHLAEHDKSVRMFCDEARLLSHLSHPSIPQGYDLGQADGYWYIAMEYVEGTNVADIWRAGAKQSQMMPLPVAIAIVAQACEALHHAHERRDRAGRPLRIVHRDVTPHNLMTTRDGVAKLLDFGVAATSARKDTDAGVLKGTFSYMAPEQVRAKPLDKRADVFALGVILYELTTGSRLFRGTDVQIMTQIVEHDVPPPTSRAQDYPPELETIVLSALERDRAKRMPSAFHFALMLEDFALRNAFAIGQRAIAKYVQAVLPAEPVLDEALAIVAPRGASAQLDDGQPHDDPTESFSAFAPPSEDDETMLDELRMLGEGSDPDGRSDALSEELGEVLPGSRPTPRVPPPDLSAFSPQSEPPIPIPIDLDELDEDPGGRPVVLLSPKKPAPADEGDFMQDLLRRLEDDTKDR